MAWRGAPPPAGVLALLDVALPAAVARQDHALKFDAYAVSSGAWGLAVNDRWESRSAFAARVTAAAESWASRPRRFSPARRSWRRPATC